ncbi:MAG TPA: hypothetical protein VLH84_02505 [Patescibacteria group bacterium]|nr:hypothetical protein [Patescibacteria group bacterium]
MSVTPDIFQLYPTVGEGPHGDPQAYSLAGSKLNSRERTAYLSGEGAVLCAHIGNQILNEIQAAPVAALHPEWTTIMPAPRDNPAARSLFLAALNFSGHVPEPSSFDMSPAQVFDENFGITQGERNRLDMHTFHGGFDAVRFAWTFSSAVANALVDDAIDKGHLSAEQKDQFTLTDWAQIIGSDWFGAMVNDLADTRMEIYRTFGDDGTTDYRKGALTAYLADRGVLADAQDPLFASSAPTSADAPFVPPAHLDEQVRRALREKKREHAGSVGCPAGHDSVVLNGETLGRDNPHVAYLATHEVIDLPEGRLETPGDKLRAKFSATAISHVLQAFSHQLVTYDQQHGTPCVDSNGELAHHKSN